MLTSYRVVSTSLLVSIGAVICYHASMVNLAWFADEIMFIVSTLNDIRAEVRCFASQSE